MAKKTELETIIGKLNLQKGWRVCKREEMPVVIGTISRIGKKDISYITEQKGMTVVLYEHTLMDSDNKFPETVINSIVVEKKGKIVMKKDEVYDVGEYGDVGMIGKAYDTVKWSSRYKPPASLR